MFQPTADRRIRRRPAASPRSRLRRALRCGLLLLLLLPLALATPPRPAAAGPAEAEAAPPRDVFLDRVDVNVINVAVHVTDGDGRPVGGLERGDFSVKVDGRPVEISNFYESRGAPAAAEDAPPAARVAGVPDEAEGPATAPVASAGAPETAAEPPQPQFLAVLFDNVQLRPSDRKRVIDGLREMLPRRLEQGASVLLVAAGPGGAEVVTPFTTDRQAVDAGLDRIGRMVAFRQIDETRTRNMMMLAQTDLNAGGSAADVAASRGGVTSAAQALQQRRLDDAQKSARGIADVLEMLGGIPGRKAAIYVSDGLAERAGAEVEGLIDAEQQDPGTALWSARGAAPFGGDLRRRYRDLGEMANAQDVTLYAIDARGPNDDFHLNAASGDILGLATPGGPAIESADFEQTRDLSLQEPLLDMAFATGGQAILNTFNVGDRLAAVGRDFDDFYSLGFLSPAGDDGEYHHIEVSVERPGVRVRHRHGYFDKPPVERVADRTRSFLVQRWESNPLGVRLEFGTPEKQRRHWRVPILVRIPAQRLALLPAGERLRGRVQLLVAVRDEEGRESPITRLAWDVDLPREGAPAGVAGAQVAADGTGSPGSDLGYALHLELRSGLSQLQLGLWDEYGGTESYVHQRVRIDEEG